jgi:hypothetical protein
MVPSIDSISEGRLLMRIRVRLLTALFGVTALITPSLPTASPVAERESSAPSRPGDVVRLWHGKTPTAKTDEYDTHPARGGIKKVEATPGHRGVQVLCRIQGKVTHSRNEAIVGFSVSRGG